MNAWYLIYTKPRQEHVALENLSRQHYTTYLPLLRSRQRRRGASVTTVGPMFPRYLFIYLDDQRDDWGPIRSTVGVAKLVRFGVDAARVPADFVDTLRQRAGADGIHTAPERVLRLGDSVRICEGVMAGYEAVFQARSSRERVVLLLEVAGLTARIQVAASTVEPLGSLS